MKTQTTRRRAALLAALTLALFLPCSVGLAGDTAAPLRQGGKLKKEGTLGDVYCTYVVTNVAGKCTSYTPGTIVYIPRSSPQAACYATLTAVKNLNNPKSACGLSLMLLPEIAPEVGNTGKTLGGGWIVF